MARLKVWGIRVVGKPSQRAAPVSFSVDGGEIVAVLGRGGSGKTALLRALAGIEVPVGGSVIFDGEDVRNRRMRKKVGYMAQDQVLPPEIKGREWLWYLTGHRATDCASRVMLFRNAASIAELGIQLEGRLGTYTRSMISRLSLGQALGMGSEVAILDDPFRGADHRSAEAMNQEIAGYASRGHPVVIATNELGSVERIATRVILLERGIVVADTGIAPLLSDRVAELTLTVDFERAQTRLALLFNGVKVTDCGVAVPLAGGLTMERLLAVCRSERIPVAGSRIRSLRLDDFVDARSTENANGKTSGVGM